MMDVRPLHNERDYDWALREATRYFEHQPDPGTADGDRFEVLSTLIKQYEDMHFEIPPTDPVGVLEFAIQSMGRSQAALGDLIGRNSASEILGRIRPLTLNMIRTISVEWSIPIELLTPQYFRREPQ
jgi:HTH-type transcriptional regulator / antitoxin HigA